MRGETQHSWTPLYLREAFFIRLRRLSMVQVRPQLASSSFMTSPSYFFTSESVSEGHPDKMCDQISDAVLDAIIAKDPNARVACETSTTTGVVFVFGEITTNAYVDIQQLVRDTVRGI